MKILIIDDEESIRFSLKVSLGKLGFESLVAETGEEGLELFKSHSPKLAIVDIKLPGIDGIEVLKRIKKVDPDCIVIMITYLSEVRLAVKSMKIGAYDYFMKPFSLAEINNAVKKAARYIEKKQELDKLNYESEFIGESAPIKNIKDIIEVISKLEMSTHVLIQGESGTGKEVVAELIHEKMRKDKAFVPLNCSAIPKNLQESELFGYEKGAFTGASESKEGLIGKSHEGILFLDEIGDMDLSLQAKLLRVLQEKKYRPIGSLEEKEFDTTIIAATNKNLQEEVKKGNFRDDLYYRLNIIPIYIPPLRERKEDIPLLIYSFLEEYNLKLNKGIKKVDKEAMDILLNYNWPGNIRELKNVIERMAIFNKGDSIYIKDLPNEIKSYFYEEKKKLSPLEIAELKVILSSLERHDWNISKVSEELNISRQTIRRKMGKYDLEK
ncbi:sigma-54-dependent transcriptional regulator [Anaerosalibacter massiliensis]|uniref:Sigma-54 dependent transcriptional regulator n=1 Tax=Anaerosalibacter massiliensis TaxID=1347392 RepID=A0A9X2S5U6_9FIRM|nr:sigma-54 dependent transcriptional regulator [Anaerosalibacter massiliensis]MCR2044923.1 sigma-54 dependent transcriptional regulator [Anaerosalibacter massiliensis]